MRGGSPIVAFILIVGIVVGACAGPDPERLTGVLDGLSVPAAWEDVKTVVHATGGDVDCPVSFLSDCPYVVRFYRAKVEPAMAYADGAAGLRADGFDLESEYDPTCERTEGPPCGFTAVRGSDRIQVNVYRPGTDDGEGVALAGFVTVRLTVRG